MSERMSTTLPFLTMSRLEELGSAVSGTCSGSPLPYLNHYKLDWKDLTDYNFLAIEADIEIALEVELEISLCRICGWWGYSGEVIEEVAGELACADCLEESEEEDE